MAFLWWESEDKYPTANKKDIQNNIEEAKSNKYEYKGKFYKTKEARDYARYMDRKHM